MSNFPLLTTTIFSPLLGVLLSLLVINSETSFGKKCLKVIALLSTVATFILSLLLYINFDFSGKGHFQFQEKYQWFDNYNISFYVGIDSISLYLTMLTSFLMIICIVCSWESITHKIKEYFIAFLVLEVLIIGTFSALDLILFYVFFEAVLIPMFLVIGLWGGENRIYAAYKFFLYTLFGSVFLLIAIIYIYQTTGTSNVLDLFWVVSKFEPNIQRCLWLAFFMSFAIKIPMWPLHTWLPDAHVQAPTAGSVILAGVLLKMGGYGFIRFSLPMLPEASVYFSNFVYALSVIAIIYASLVAFAQTNIKKLIAYSSVAHMGYVTIGIFAGNTQGINGAVIQMISHGLISGALFLSSGMLSDRTHIKDMEQYGGAARAMPLFASLLMVLTISSVALPGTSAFIGEILTLVGIYKVNKFYAILALSGMVLGAIYMLWFYARVMFGESRNKEIFTTLNDLNFKEAAMLISIIVCVIIIGVYPVFMLNDLKEAVNSIVTHFQLYQ